MLKDYIRQQKLKDINVPAYGYFVNIRFASKLHALYSLPREKSLFAHHYLLAFLWKRLNNIFRIFTNGKAGFFCGTLNKWGTRFQAQLLTVLFNKRETACQVDEVCASRAFTMLAKSHFISTLGNGVHQRMKQPLYFYVPHHYVTD